MRVESTDSTELPRGSAGSDPPASSALGASTEAPAGQDLVWFPIAQRALAPVELLEYAKENLRCVEWENVDLQLMTGAILGSSQKMGNLYHLSRPVAPGERPDWFLSHSWHDDAEAKYAKLCSLAAAFHRGHRRWPTLWLDKVCIDQDNIGDGLRALPVNVMACQRMLVICGRTYPTRLWCAWELFVLCIFLRDGKAGTLRDRLLIVSLDEDAALDAFDVTQARCYDPNEESRLRQVIEPLGAGRFNDRIRSLAQECAAEAPTSRLSRLFRSTSRLSRRSTKKMSKSTSDIRITRITEDGAHSPPPSPDDAFVEGQPFSPGRPASPLPGTRDLFVEGTPSSAERAAERAGGSVEAAELERV